MSYKDVMEMTTYDRRLFLNFFKTEKTKEKEHYETVKQQQSNGGKKTLSGDEMKNFARENQ